MEHKILLSMEEADLIKKYLDLFVETAGGRNIISNRAKSTQVYYNVKEVAEIINGLT